MTCAVAGKQGKPDPSESSRYLDLKESTLGTGDSSGQEVMQKFVGEESGKACVEDDFSTEDSDNESPVTVSVPCCESENKPEDSKGACLKVRQKGSERQVWGELYGSESSTMPKSSSNHTKPKAGRSDKHINPGGRRSAAPRGESRTSLEVDNGSFCGEHTERNRSQQSDVDEALAGLCGLSVSSQSAPPRSNGHHKGAGDGRGRQTGDRGVMRPKTSNRDADATPQNGGCGEHDASRRKGANRKQSVLAPVPTAAVVPPTVEGYRRRKSSTRASASEDHGASCSPVDEEVLIVQSTGTEKKTIAATRRSVSAERVSVDDEAGGGTNELKQGGVEGTAWSSSDGGSTSHSGRSSGSSSSSYAGSGSEEDNDEHRDPEDDWETAADALYTHSMYRNSGEGKGKGYKGDSLGGKDGLDKKNNGFSSSDLQHGGVLKPEYKYKANGFGGRMRGNGGRAWRPDDVSRPPTLPRLTKQHSYPVQSAQGVWGPVHGNMWGPPATPSYCPICTEELDMTDSSFVPCSCGFRLCLFCHHRIASDDGRCPGCRKAYNSDVAMKLSRSASLWLRA